MVLAAAVCVACAEAEIEEATNNAIGSDKIYATIDEAECDDTRVELNERKQTVWNEGDKIFVYCNNYFREYTFDGKTGARSGSFSCTGNYESPGDDAIVDYDKYYAVHLTTYRYGWYSDGVPVFYTLLPATQGYKKNSYGTDTNAMLGTSDDGTNFAFKNLFGYMRFGITGNKRVKSIVISGNNGETMAGELIVNKDAELIQWYNSDDISLSKSITIDCGDGVQLTDEPTHFYATLPTIQFSYGINLTVNFTDGTTFTKRTSKTINILRNTIQPMASFPTGDDVKWQTATIKHSGDSVGFIYIYGATSLSGYIYWGDGNMSEINTTASYVYEDGSAEHTITVKALDATDFWVGDLSGISEIDLSNF